MLKITLFEVMLVVHFLMDWVFQTSWEVKNKEKKILPLVFHCSVYTAGFAVLFYFYNINFLWLFFIFFSHIFIDRRKFVHWLLKLKGFKKEEMEKFRFFILSIGLDQILHITVLATIALLI